MFHFCACTINDHRNAGGGALGGCLPKARSCPALPEKHSSDPPPSDEEDEACGGGGWPARPLRCPEKLADVFNTTVLFYGPKRRHRLPPVTDSSNEKTSSTPSNSLPSVPSPRLPVDRDPEPSSPAVVPRLDLHQLRKKPKRKLIALDVANILTQSTAMAVGREQQQVHFETLIPGREARSSPTPMVTNQRRNRQKRMSCPTDEISACTRLSFTGPGFAPLPQSKTLSPGESSLPVFRKSALMEPRDSIQHSQNDIIDTGITELFKARKKQPGLRKKSKAASVDSNDLNFAPPPQEGEGAYRRVKVVCSRGRAEDLVELLGDNAPIPSCYVHLNHPWLSPPAHVCSLAACVLTQATSTSAAWADDEQLAKRAVVQLISNLDGDESAPDIVESSLLALAYLTMQSQRNAEIAFENDCLPWLIKLLRPGGKSGVHGTAAQVCRDVFVLDVKRRKVFKELDGVTALVTLLDDGADSQLKTEAIGYIEEFIMVNGEEISEYIDLLKVLSLDSKLASLHDENYPELHSTAKQLYLRIAE